MVNLLQTSLRTQLDEERTAREDLKKKLDELSDALEQEITAKKGLQTKLEEREEMIANLQKLVDQDEVNGKELKSQLENETNTYRTLEQELERERQVRGELEREIAELGRVLLHEKRLKDDAESEGVALRQAVKQACAREGHMRTEVTALQAAIHTLEEESSLRNTQGKGTGRM